jgi:hypothetical protein
MTALRFLSTPLGPRFWPFAIPDGTLEALKWLALASMAYDHAMRYLVPGISVNEATVFGRIAFPLFAFIIAHNLSRPGNGPEVYRRVIGRLLIFGALSIPAYAVLVGPGRLNILFTFATAIGILWLFELRNRFWWSPAAALALFLAANPLVEYNWFGLVLILSFFAWRRLGMTVGSVALLAFGFLALSLSNGNHWGLTALLFILMAHRIALALPRSKWLFYVFYPAHLTLIALIAAALAR